METRSRDRMQGKARALATATRVSESCLGLALLRNHDGEDRAHVEKLRGLEKENRNVQNELEHQRKQFLKRRLGTPGPMIILEQTRVPDPLGSDGDGNGKRGRMPKRRGRRIVEVRETDGRTVSRPGYMMPTKCRGAVTSSTSTIGAFRISTQRPLDRWNPAILQKIYFKSAILPSWPLTESDVGELRTTLSRHCWIRKFRDPGPTASAENGGRSNRSKRRSRGIGLGKGRSDEQVEQNRNVSDGEEEPEILEPGGSQITHSTGVRSRSHSQPTSFRSRQLNPLTTKSAEVEKRYQILPAITDNNNQSGVAKSIKTRLSSKNRSTLSEVRPLLRSEEHLFQTAIEYSIPDSENDVRNPDNRGDPNNTISSESGIDKTASDSDGLSEMTSPRKLPKSLRAVSFSDDVRNIDSRRSEIDGA